MKKKDRDLFMDVIDSAFISMLDVADKQKCEISVKSDTKGYKHIKAEGNNMALLVTLAGLEKQILKNTETNEEEFNLIKEYIDTAEAPNE